MRKILLGLLSILLLILAVNMTMRGTSIGGLKINSIPTIKEENDLLENKIQSASKLRDVDYPQNVQLLEGAFKKLVSEKEGYEQLLALGVDDNGQPLSKIQEYEIEKIWITIGNYATKQGVDVKMDITSNNSISKTYDLNFTVSGGYIQIIDFLYDIEQDKTLVFKIENFKMVPGGSGGKSTVKEEENSSEDTEESSETSNDVALTATFTCKDIKLNISEASGDQQENNQTEGNTENTGNTDATNTTEQQNNTPGGTTNTNTTNTTTNTNNTTNTNTNTNTTNTTNTNSTTNTNTTNTNTIQ